MRKLVLVAAFATPFTIALVSAQQPTAPAQASAGASPRITLIRSCQIAEGKGEEARKWATDIIAATKTAGGKPPFEAAASYQEVFGELGRVHFVLEFADLNAVGRWMESPPPAKIQEMMKQAPSLLPKCEDTLLRQLGQRQQF